MQLLGICPKLTGCMLLNGQKQLSAKLNAQHNVINPPQLGSNNFFQFSKYNSHPRMSCFSGRIN